MALQSARREEAIHREEADASAYRRPSSFRGDPKRAVQKRHSVCRWAIAHSRHNGMISDAGLRRYAPSWGRTRLVPLIQIE